MCPGPSPVLKSCHHVQELPKENPLVLFYPFPSSFLVPLPPVESNQEDCNPSGEFIIGTFSLTVVIPLQMQELFLLKSRIGMQMMTQYLFGRPWILFSGTDTPPATRSNKLIDKNHDPKENGDTIRRNRLIYRKLRCPTAELLALEEGD